MDTREWYERFQAEWLQQAEERGFRRGQTQSKLEGWLEGRLEMTARFYAIRLGRPLSEAEHAALASLLTRVGQDRVLRAVVSFSAEALGAWLADPNAE